MLTIEREFVHSMYSTYCRTLSDSILFSNIRKLFLSSLDTCIGNYVVIQLGEKPLKTAIFVTETGFDWTILSGADTTKNTDCNRSPRIGSIINNIGVSRGGGQGGPDPPFPGPPFFICDPPSTQPDLTDKCNVNCFLIV